MTASFWYNKPTELVNPQQISMVWPTPSMSYAEKLNAITRLVIILSIVGYLITKSYKIAFSGLITIVGIVLLFLNNPNNTPEKYKQQVLDSLNTEGFTGQAAMEALKDNFSEPTTNNPLQNTEVIGSDVERKPAPPSFNPIVNEQINEAAKKQIQELNPDIPEIDKKLFKDLGDHENFENSMRPFYSMPNTRTPNDQRSFTDFCYGDMESRKEENGLLNVNKF